MKKDNYYFIYAKPLRDALLRSGEEFICVARAISNNEKFWLFEKNDNSIQIVNMYNSIKYEEAI